MSSKLTFTVEADRDINYFSPPLDLVLGLQRLSRVGRTECRAEIIDEDDEVPRDPIEDRCATAILNLLAGASVDIPGGTRGREG